MGDNVYAIEVMMVQRLADLRAAAARAALVESARDGQRGAAAVVGAALIRAGQWLARGEAGAAPNGVRVAR